MRRLEERERALAREWERKEKQKLAELEQRADESIARFEARAAEVIAEIELAREARKAAVEARRKAAQTARQWREEFAASVVSKEAAAPAGGVREGAMVRLRGVSRPARVRRLLGEGGIEVEAGYLKLQVPREDVIEVLPAEAAGGHQKPFRLEAGPRWNVVSREINVVGRRAEEACEQVDKFLDDAVLASVDRVRIVHGHGMGVLRKAIGELLARHPHVERFYPAPPGEGGTGATIAELRAV